MQCSKCKLENPDTQRFCGNCGAKLEKACPKCGISNPPQYKFCGECGHDLKESPEKPSIDFNEPLSYTPKILVDKILTTRSSIEGERKLVTVLFADVANYTSMAEKLDPEEVKQIMEGCFKILLDEIHKYEGTVNQFTGDGVMALFGAPVAHEDHVQRSCYAALSIQKAMEEYGEKIKRDYGVEFKMRIGLNSGTVVVGLIGDNLRMDYTAIGDTTNLASRMESLAKAGSTLVSEHTHKIAREYFEFESLGKVQVKGKKALQEAYTLIKPGKVKTRIEVSAAKGLTKFVGREREKEHLQESFDKARSGSGQVVGIVGEAGMGKSRLVVELRNALHEFKHIYLEGRCSQYGFSISYLPILEILRSCFEIKEGDQEAIVKKKIKEKLLEVDENLLRVLPSFHDLFSVKVEDENYLNLELQQKKEKIFEAIRDLLVQISQNNPLILVVEDLHWVDKISEDFLDYFVGCLPNTRVLLLLLYRSEYVHPWGSKSFYSKVGVDQLSTKNSSELVQSILGGGKAVPEISELILNKASGNPLVIEEFIHSLFEDGTIKRKANQYVLSKSFSDIQIPDNIQGIIASRMDHLEENVKNILQIASVIGKEFSFRILYRIIGIQEELKACLIKLQGLEFIYEKQLFPEPEYAFKHALIQEVAYNSLLLKRRKEIHEKIGRAIEELFSEKLEEFYEMLAYHYTRSDNWEKAYHYLRLSGEKATRNFSNWEAFHLFKKAVEILKQRPEEDDNKREQVKILSLIIPSMHLLGYPEDSLQILKEGEMLSRELGDETRLVTFYSRIGQVYSFKGDPRGIEYTQKSFLVAEKTQNLELMASTAMGLCASYQIAGNFQNVVEVAHKLVDLLEKDQKQAEFYVEGFNVYSILCLWYGLDLALLGNFKEGEVLCEKALRFAIEINHLPTLGFVESQYGFLCGIKGKSSNTIKHFQKSISYFEEGQNVIYLGLAWTGLGFGYYFSGSLATAHNLAEKGLRYHLDTGNPFYLSLLYCINAMIHFDLEDLNNAQTCAQKALEFSQQNNEKASEGVALSLLGRILGREDPSQVDKAKNYMLQGIKILEDVQYKPYYSVGHFYLGELFANAGIKEMALKYLTSAKGMFEEMEMDYWLEKTNEILGKIQ